MAVIKRRTRKKLTKHLGKLVRKHGAEMALALVTGIVSSLAAADDDRPRRKAKTAARTRATAVARVPRRGAAARKRMAAPAHP